MFIGHFAAGMGAKAAAPAVSLGTLFLAAQFLDLLWPTFLLLGWETVEIEPGITAMTPLDFTSYPISHSLLTSIGWGILIGGIYWLIRREWKGSLVLGLLVVSHWVLDLIVHRPDLPLYPGHSPLVGFGLWNSVPATLIVEGLIFVIGVGLYLRVTAAKDRIGKWGFWALIAFLLAIYISNLFGPPPPEVKAIAWVGQAQWLIVIWGFWVDKHR